jgi:hypothetical protein
MTRIQKAIELAMELIDNGMDVPLSIHKAAEHYGLSNRLLAREMGKRKRTKHEPVEPPVDAWWQK